MAVFSVFTLEESNITISGGGQLSGITQGNGSHLVGETITLNNNNWVKVDVDDSNDSNFNDSDNSQTLDAAITYNGTAYAAGLRVETEFGLTVQDPDGNTYTILAFNINEPGVLSFSTVEGLAFVGGVGDFPPIGVPLTVISNQEGLSRPFSSLASPQCFTRGCRIDTPHGPRLIEELCLGDVGEHLKAWGNYAAHLVWLLSFIPGYHCSNLSRNVPSRVRVRVCSMRCAPAFDHRIC